MTGSDRAEPDATTVSLSRMRALVPEKVDDGLDVVDARRRRLYAVGAVAVIGAATIATIVLTVGQVNLPWWVGWALLATTALFVVDAAMQERHLAALTRTMVAQRERGAALEATVGDLGALLEIARRVNGVLLPEEIYDVVLDAAVDLLRAESGSIRLRVGELLAVAASRGDDAPRVGTTGDVEDDPAVVVVTLGVDIIEEAPPRLALPITVGERHVGVLEVRRAADADPFTARSAQLGRLFAEQAAAAVSNAGRYDLERSRAEELRSDRETRTDAIADTVHDLRGPLAGLLGWAELLRDRWEDLAEGKRDEAVHGVHDAGMELKGLIDEVFDSASAEAQAVRVREPVALAPLVRTVAASIEASGVVADASVELQFETEPIVLGDPDAIQRVVRNLVGNALEHGSSTVRVRVQSRRREARLHVTDRGPGIPEEHLETLFRRRLRDEGSPRGRGLPIVDALVRAMGGRVGVRTQEGVGTVFTVTLPCPDDDVDR